jgi:hypothetical protein
MGLYGNFCAILEMPQHMAGFLLSKAVNHVVQQSGVESKSLLVFKVHFYLKDETGYGLL